MLIHPDRKRTDLIRTALALLFSASFLASSIMLGRTESTGSDFYYLISWYISLFFSAGLLFLTIPKHLPRIKIEIFILLISLLSRLALISFPVSDDVNRYIWEGKMVSMGINPYQKAPLDKTLIEFRDKNWEGINHKDQTACYPPLSLYLFSLTSRLCDSPLMLKLIFMLLDLASVFILLLLLRIRCLNERYALIYALNPLIIVSFSGQAHLDVLMILFMMSSLLFYYKGQWFLMFTALALSVQAKYMSLLLLPFMLSKENIKQSWIFFLILLIPFIPFVYRGEFSIFNSLTAFSLTMAHNGTVHKLLRSIFSNISPASMICGGMFLLIYSYYYLNRGRDLLYSIMTVLSFLLFFSPTIHLWYLSWLLPFLCFFPRSSWLLLSLTACCYFSADQRYFYTALWYQPWAYYLIQWLPFLVLFLAEIYKKKYAPLKKKEFPDIETVSIIIPVYNAAKHLQKCLDSLNLMSRQPLEIIAVDGGSTDNTADILRQNNIPVISSPKGRGGQIWHGILSSRGDACIILHSDSLPGRNLVSSVITSLNSNPATIGGAAGQSFFNPQPGLLLIELLNDLRAEITRISFGDQVQFFRRHTVKEKGLFPRIPLMEDVEFSLRLAALGELLYLWQSNLVSNIMWTDRLSRRFSSTIRLLGKFFLRRLRGRLKTDDLYQIYYGEKS